MVLAWVVVATITFPGCKKKSSDQPKQKCKVVRIRTMNGKSVCAAMCYEWPLGFAQSGRYGYGIRVPCEWHGQEILVD